MSLNNTPSAEVSDRLRADLRAAGLRVTDQRLGVLETLEGDVTHPTAHEIFERLRARFPGMAFATVYNTLAALGRVGRVRPVTVGGATRFDPNTSAHHHAVCSRCGAVRDVAPLAAPAPTSERPIAGFMVDTVEVVYRGTCARCASGLRGRRAKMSGRRRRRPASTKGT